MASNAGALKVTAPTVGAATVTLTSASGVVPVAYSDPALTTTTALPFTLAAGATGTVYLLSAGTYTLSVQVNGIEGANPRTGSTVTFDLSPGETATYNYAALDYPGGTGWATGSVVPSAAPRANYGSPPLGSKMDATLYTAPNGSVLSIPTYVGGNNEVVEPSVYYNPNGFGGYEYWMAAGPYEGANAAYENPSIWVSHDGITWVVPPGATNPVAGPPASGNYDDPHLFEYGGVLYLTWNWSRTAGLADQVLYKTTTDGVTWTATQVLVTGVSTSSHELLSPHVAYQGGVWYLWTLSIVGGAPNAVYLRTASTFAGLGAATPTLCTTAVPSGLDNWEFEVRRVGAEWWMLQTLVTTGQTAAGGRLYLRTSADGVTWTLPPNPILAATSGGSDFDGNFIYKATFLPLADGRIAIWYSAGSLTTIRWKIGYTVATQRQRPQPLLSSYWFAPQCSAVTTAVMVQAEVKLVPVYFDRPTPLSALGLEVTGAGATGSVVRLGVYLDNGKGQPYNLLIDSGTIDGTVVGFASLASSVTVNGVVWLAACGQGSPATQPTVRSHTGASLVPIGASTFTLVSQNALACYRLSSGATGALPSQLNLAALTQQATATRVLFQPA